MAHSTTVKYETIDHINESNSVTKHRPMKLRRLQSFLIIFLHMVTLYAVVFKLYVMNILTLFYALFLVCLANFGTTAGAHRLWTHRSFKAKEPLRLLLFFGFALASHMTLYIWVRIHRVHHKFTDTEADPHNAKRGFFYSHMGWFMLEKTPECEEKEKEANMSDMKIDPLVNFHSRYFYRISLAMFFLPSLIPVYFWGEDLYVSILATGFLRYCLTVHCASSVNSFAHMYGSKPYDKRILPVESPIVSFFAIGEGWHNYHHTFPWDYKAAEFGDRMNLTARLLDMFAKLGWAYDLKTVSPELIAKMKDKYGDRNNHNEFISHPKHLS